jgi:hypothetical protein
MNFYISIFKKQFHPKKWILFVFLFVSLISSIVFTVNIIVDPYNITKYNLLNIKYKFARDDRVEKLNYFQTLEKFDNILIGSSRVYSMNPKIVSDILGGTTYNFGVGTATVEDHLGILKYLVKTKKIPKNIIVGIDFYTFNPDTPANKYFLKNKELNFLSFGEYHENYIGKFFSIDAFRASFKTLRNHFFTKDSKPKFDKFGFAGTYENYSTRNIEKENTKVVMEARIEIEKIYSNYSYSKIDQKRVLYFNQIKEICSKNNINLYIFTTPLHPVLLDMLYQHQTKYALKELLEYLSSFENFQNLYYNKKLYTDLKNFHGATHTSTNAGDIILSVLLNKK